MSTRGLAVQMKCLECGAESTGAVVVCARCGAPIHPAPGPGPGAQAPAWPRPRRVPRGYSWMAWGAVFCGVALVFAGGYFQQLSSPWDRWYFLAGIAPGVLALILFGQHIQWSRFLRRPGQPSSATVTARYRGGRRLMLDAPSDVDPSGLEVRLAWWAEPAMLPPGENVTFYGPRGGKGRVLVSGPGPGRAVVGTGRRTAALADVEALPGALSQPGGQRAGRRYPRWGPLAVFCCGLAAAVMAMLAVEVPALTGHLGLAQLRPGDCLTSSNMDLGGGGTWPFMVAAAPCTSPHIAEVFYAGNAWPQSMAYPGDEAVGDQAYARCLTAFSAYDGAGESQSAFSIQTIVPMPAGDWGSGDRWLVCIAYDSAFQYPGGTPAPVDYSIKASSK